LFAEGNLNRIDVLEAENERLQRQIHKLERKQPSKPNEIVMNGHFYWTSPLRPGWTSVFFRHSDVIPDFGVLNDYLGSFRQEEVEFVTVIGGMAYLEFISRNRFRRITYFDGNVNEITKLSLVHKSIVNNHFEQYNYFTDVAEGIARDPGEFYLPKPLLDQGFTMAAQESAGKVSGDPRFLFPPGPLPETWHGPTAPSPMWTLLPPDNDCAGGGCWNPSVQEYNTARDAVLDDMNEQVFFSMPYLNDTSGAVVVYLDGILPGSAETGVPWQEGWEPYPDWASPAALRARFPKARMILPIYTYQEGKNDVNNPNKHWDDAHMWWEFFVLQHSVGTTLHVWSAEYAQFLGSVYDNAFTKSTTMVQFMQGEWAINRLNRLVRLGEWAIYRLNRLVRLGEWVPKCNN
jgi:hypothetical protein